MAIELIERIDIDATEPSVIYFQNIPQDGTHLLLIGSVRSGVGNGNGTPEDVIVNNDSSTNSHTYSSLFWGNGNASALRLAGQNSARTWYNTGDSTTAYHFANGTLWFFDYTVSGHQNFIAYGGHSWEHLTANYHYLSGGVYDESDPITELRLQTSTSHKQYSSFSLYKVT